MDRVTKGERVRSDVGNRLQAGFKALPPARGRHLIH